MDGLTFKGDTDFTLGISGTKGWNGTVEWSTDGTTWTVWDGSKPISSNANYLYLRGKNDYFGSYQGMSIIHTTFVLAGKASKVECTGNIMTLLDYKNPPTTITKDYCFYFLFENCKNLTKAPELPATSLAAECYYGMFCGCTGLKAAPKLPATSLARSCYGYMFKGCTTLDSVGKIASGNQVTTASSCFEYMFKDCSNLNVEKLPSPDGTQFVYLDSNGASNSSGMFNSIGSGTVTTENDAAYKIKTN